MARYPRLGAWLINGMWAVVRGARAVLSAVYRVRILPIGVQHWDNGVTFGVLIIYYRRRSASPANGKE